jgi:ABC-type sugar transport system substrate-binding protein
VTAIKDHSTRISATGAQDPYAIAQQRVVITNDTLLGKKPTKPVVKLKLKPMLVTQDNVDSYKGWTSSRTSYLWRHRTEAGTASRRCRAERSQ